MFFLERFQVEIGGRFVDFRDRKMSPICSDLLMFTITGSCLVMSLNEAIEQEAAGGSHHAGLFF